jgi:hypothetical protein
MSSALQDVMRDEHRIDEHVRHLLRMQHRKLHTELTQLQSGVYQPSTEYLEAHRKDLPGERAELTRFRRHSIATWYRHNSPWLGEGKPMDTRWLRRRVRVSMSLSLVHDDCTA